MNFLKKYWVPIAVSALLVLALIFYLFSARCQNRMNSARIIFITISVSPLEFFSLSKEIRTEDLSQFLRRIDTLITLRSDASSSDVLFFQSYPREMAMHTRKIPHSDRIVKLTYDFDDYHQMTEEEMTDFILERVRLNNRWENDIKRPTSATLGRDTSKS